MPSKLKKAIGAVKDQTSISIAKVASNSSSTLEVAVLKATTHDDVPIDDRYVQEVIKLVSSNKAYAAACARAIGKRIGRTRNWIVALKSLMLVLRLFQDGDPYFPREVLHAMKRGAKILNLSSFRDDSNSSPWDFTAFIRTFALYLDERLDCFLTGKLQRRYNHRERENFSSHFRSTGSHRRRGDEPVRDMKPVMLLDKITYWQRLIERAIATRPTGAAKTNRLVQIALYAVVTESFDLYKDISDGLALVLDSFFHLPYQSCVNAFQTCVKAAKQFEEISAFYSVCKSIGVGRTSEYPSVQIISEELIETLQEFLKDQSSFPAHTQSKSHLLLPAPPGGGSTRTTSSKRDSYGGQSEFSTATETTEKSTSSHVNSRCTSLEDLISATETWKSPANISIDLEAYSSDIKQLNEKDDTRSTHSLPVSNSMADLVSLPDLQEYDDDNEKKQEEEKQVKDKEAEIGQHHKQNPSLDSTSSAKGWELVLAEAIPSTSFNSFSEQPKPDQARGAITPSASFNAFPEQPKPDQVRGGLTPSASFNAFPEQPKLDQARGTITPSASFNAFPEQPRPDQARGMITPSASFNAFPEQPRPDQARVTLTPSASFNAFPEQPRPDQARGTITPSASFNVFPEQPKPDQARGTITPSASFNAFPEQPRPDQARGTITPSASFNAFPEQPRPDQARGTITPSASFNAFPEQPRPDQARGTLTPSASFNAFPEQPKPDQARGAITPSASFNAFPEEPKPDQARGVMVNAFPEQPKPDQTRGMITPSASFNAFPEQVQENVPTNEAQGSPAAAAAEEVSSSKGWELVLFENIPQAQSTQPVPSTTNNNNVNSFSFATLDNLYNQNQTSFYPNNGLNSQFNPHTNNFSYDQNHSMNMPPPNNGLNTYHHHQEPVLPAPQHYNPFLQDLSMELAMVPVTGAPAHPYPTMATNSSFSFPTSTDMFTSSAPAPTFRATPTFSAQSHTTGPMHGTNMDDPFAAFSSSDHHKFNGIKNEQNLMQEQQLWLHNQNKIIAKHRA